MSENPAGHGRRPAAYRLDDPALGGIRETMLEEAEPSFDEAHDAVEMIVHPPRRRFRWGVLAATTASTLVALAIGIAVDSLIRDLFARADWLGWLALALAGLFVLSVLAIVGREVAGVFRLKRLARLRLLADKAAESNDRSEADRTVAALLAHYSGRADTAQGRRAVAGHAAEVMDGRDLLVLAERDLVRPLDVRARTIISGTARRVSVVTAVSPRAFLDIAYVLWESVRLIRRLSVLYGGRPGTLGLFRLTKAVFAHLAVTGTIAIGDTIVQQVLGHGIAARLSARFGEGVVNGLMTARIGLAAMDVCRPLPFLREERPRLKDLASGLVSGSERDALRQP
ncbi:YcjF family protein [Propylenella binzhouense]|uniref:TIGR01620 family protein n=1 Tax=Propylenella binzhouense TaxID=2555902 RepID=A0A964T8P8_9HYPH|nr:TIGR01620 family protein [Propylenella binzhouense]MYZ49922.1 TIGR01620 family protein [Propylenella binzhouense]